MIQTETKHTIGRRKTSVARIFMSAGTGKVMVNGKDYKTYFPLLLHDKINHPFVLTATEGAYDLKVNVCGGGTTGQVEAVRLAISRALVDINPEFKPLLKVENLLTRDSRKVERKKFGHKKARKSSQFSKR